MPQSFAHVPLHIIFSTKERQNWILPQIEQKLFAFMGSVCNQLQCKPIIINGVEDHVHLLVYLSRTITIAKFLEKLKVESSKWMKRQGQYYQHFSWQRGYAAFAVENIPRIKNYILGQKDHHHGTGIDFKKELIKILNYYEIPYDERYLWD